MATSFLRELLGIGDDPVSNGVYSYFALKEADEFLPNKRHRLEEENLELRNEAMRKEYGISEEDASLDSRLLLGAAYGLDKAKQGLPAPKAALHFNGVDNIQDLLLRTSHGPSIRFNLAPVSREFSTIKSGSSFANSLVKRIRTAKL